MPPAGDAPVWSVEEASRYFADAGIPVEPRRLAAIIRALDWRPVGETRSGVKGGRGKALYLTSDFQRLHRDLAEWLVRIPDPGAGSSEDPREAAGSLRQGGFGV
jgi:hypothetical protein